MNASQENEGALSFEKNNRPSQGGVSQCDEFEDAWGRMEEDTFK